MECNYCKKTFSSKSNLNKHQATAKYCIEIRFIKKKTKHKPKKFECNLCDKIYKSKQSLQNHISKNHEKEMELEKIITVLKKQLKEKDLMIEKLQDRLENIAIKASTKPTTINNRNTYIQNNLTPLTDNDFVKDLDKLTARMIMNGYEKIGEML